MILLLGGTSESLEIADSFNDANLDFILSVTTDYGAEVASKHAKYVSNMLLLPSLIHDFFKTNQIDLIVDATHPFARSISTHMMEASLTEDVPYIRYEREEIPEQGQFLKVVKSIEDAIKLLEDNQDQVYLSTGSKTAPDFASVLGVERLHVRVLPTTNVLEKLTDAGFQANQIDALQGPFTTALNMELFKRSGAQVVITKASGTQGGVQEKIAACEQLGILCIVVERPQLNYPVVCSDVHSLLEKVGEFE